MFHFLQTRHGLPDPPFQAVDWTLNTLILSEIHESCSVAAVARPTVAHQQRKRNTLHVCLCLALLKKWLICFSCLRWFAPSYCASRVVLHLPLLTVVFLQTSWDSSDSHFNFITRCLIKNRRKCPRTRQIMLMSLSAAFWQCAPNHFPTAGFYPVKDVFLLLFNHFMRSGRWWTRWQQLKFDLPLLKVLPVPLTLSWYFVCLIHWCQSAASC